MKRLMNKKILLLVSGLITILLIIYFLFIRIDTASAPLADKKPDVETSQTTEQPKETPPAVPAPTPTPAPTQQPPAFDKTKFSLTEPASIWVVVNKKRPLPSSYVPSDLTAVSGGQIRAEASTNLTNLVTTAKNAGHALSVISSYRSYSTQQTTYNGWVARDGVAQADTYSARPGHSEHQSGLAVDLGNGVCNLEICFGDTTAGKWLAANSSNFGFIIRYPSGKDNITGYQYEPWHLRYVGLELAKELQKTSQTMEEFFGLTNQASY